MLVLGREIQQSQGYVNAAQATCYGLQSVPDTAGRCGDADSRRQAGAPGREVVQAAEPAARRLVRPVQGRRQARPRSARQALAVTRTRVALAAVVLVTASVGGARGRRRSAVLEAPAGPEALATRYPGQVELKSALGRYGLWAGIVAQTTWQQDSHRDRIPLWALVNYRLSVEPTAFEKLLARAGPNPTARDRVRRHPPYGRLRGLGPLLHRRPRRSRAGHAAQAPLARAHDRHRQRPAHRAEGVRLGPHDGAGAGLLGQLDRDRLHARGGALPDQWLQDRHARRAC